MKNLDEKVSKVLDQLDEDVSKQKVSILDVLQMGSLVPTLLSEDFNDDSNDAGIFNDLNEDEDLDIDIENDEDEAEDDVDVEEYFSRSRTNGSAKYRRLYNVLVDSNNRDNIINYFNNLNDNKKIAFAKMLKKLKEMFE